jgi:hypothetical protein
VARVHVYGDESGNFDFSRNKGASRYFILTTVTMSNHSIAAELHELRRELTWSGHDLEGQFHATEDKQAVRDEVFKILDRHEFRVDITLLDKPKSRPDVRSSEERFYKTAWFFHMNHVTPRILTQDDDLMVVAASIGTAKKRKLFHQAITEVIQQCAPTSRYRTAFWPAATDPCLQVADYCSWAIKRKWEDGDSRSYQLIASKIGSEFDLFRRSTSVYY